MSDRAGKPISKRSGLASRWTLLLIAAAFIAAPLLILYGLSRWPDTSKGLLGGSASGRFSRTLYRLPSGAFIQTRDTEQEGDVRYFFNSMVETSYFDDGSVQCVVKVYGTARPRDAVPETKPVPMDASPYALAPADLKAMWPQVEPHVFGLANPTERSYLPLDRDIARQTAMPYDELAAFVRESILKGPGTYTAFGPDHRRAMIDSIVFVTLGAISGLLGLFLLALWWRAGRRRRRLAAGRCPACGYQVNDLPRCPECGRDTPDETKPALN